MFQKSFAAIDAVDGVFYRRVERFAHWWQRLTGHTSFWLTKWLAIGVALWYLIDLTKVWLPDLWRLESGTVPNLSLFDQVGDIFSFGWFGIRLFTLCDQADVCAKHHYHLIRPWFVRLFEGSLVKLFRVISGLLMILVEPVLLGVHFQTRNHGVSSVLVESFVSLFFLLRDGAALAARAEQIRRTQGQDQGLVPQPKP